MSDMIIDDYGNDFEDYKYENMRIKTIDQAEKMLDIHGYVNLQDLIEKINVPLFSAKLFLLEDGYYEITENIYGKD